MYPDQKRITVEVQNSGPLKYLLRTLQRSSNGKRLFNDAIEVEPSAPPGLGSKIFGTQVREARRLGVNRIHTMAMTSEDENGGYTWARLGYDGYIPRGVLGRHGFEAPPPEVPWYRNKQRKQDYTTIHHIMTTPSGRDWWKAVNTDFSRNADMGDDSDERQFSWTGVFDPRPRSRHSRILDAYLKDRGIDLDD